MPPTPNPKKWKTRFTKKFPSCTLPLMSAPMAGVSGGDLAAATYHAGGLGFIAAGHLSSIKDLEEQIAIFRAAAAATTTTTTTRNKDDDNADDDDDVSSPPLAIGFISHSCFATPQSTNTIRSLLQKHKPHVVQFSFPPVLTLPSDNDDDDDDDDPQKRTTTNISLAQSFGCLVLAQVSTLSEAQMALSSGCDGLIVQGVEAGGHGARLDRGSGTLALSARVVSMVRERRQSSSTSKDDDVVVLAAGGVVDGRGLAAVLSLGCDGAVLGTRLWASREAMGGDGLKVRLERSDIDDVVRTTVMDQISKRYSSTPWPYPYDSSGVLRNELTKRWDGKECELEEALDDDETCGKIVEDYKRAEKEGDYSITPVYAGQGVGEIRSIEKAYDIICRISDEAMTIINNMTLLIE